MKIVGLGKDMSGKLIFPPLDETDAVKSLRAALEDRAPLVKTQSELGSRGVSFRGQVERTVTDLGDPRQSGWTFVVAADDPRRAEIVEILRPLAVHRAMNSPSSPLVFDGSADPGTWGDWLQENYWGLTLEQKAVPHYVLLVGDPAQLPFGFHALFDTVASVGRVDFDSPEQLEAYVNKIVRLEQAATPAVEREVLFFAPDGGPQDPTFFSRKYMAEPLADHVKKERQFDVFALAGGDANKAQLAAALHTRKPALVYTASHGLGMIGRPLADQKRLNGAICCQTAGPLTLADLFSAADVSPDQPFLEGAVFFQFACFGAGTPSESDYTHWLKGVPETYAEEDFVAALPKALLAHPRGPVAFVGHMDTAWLHGFADPHDPNIVERWDRRIAPFLNAIDGLLSAQPVARAMQFMNERYAVLNSVLANTYDRDRRGKLKWTDEVSQRFLDSWILRSDAQNYMVLGDPAAALRIPA